MSVCSVALIGATTDDGTIRGNTLILTNDEGKPLIVAGEGWRGNGFLSVSSTKTGKELIYAGADTAVYSSYSLKRAQSTRKPEPCFSPVRRFWRAAVTGIAQCERVRRHAAVPDSRLQDGAPSGVKEMTTTHQRGAGRRARRRTRERVAKDRTLARNTIDIRCVQNRVDAGPCVNIGVRAGVASPVVGENEQDIPAQWFGRRLFLQRRTSDRHDHHREHGGDSRARRSLQCRRQSRTFTRTSL